MPHSLPCHHPIHCNHGGLERFWKRLKRERGRKGKRALNLICATDRPTDRGHREGASREREDGREGGGVIYPTFPRLGFLAVLTEGENSESVFGESTRAKSSVPRPTPGIGQRRATQPRGISATHPFSGISQTCANLACVARSPSVRKRKRVRERMKTSCSSRCRPRRVGGSKGRKEENRTNGGGGMELER